MQIPDDWLTYLLGSSQLAMARSSQMIQLVISPEKKVKYGMHKNIRSLTTNATPLYTNDSDRLAIFQPHIKYFTFDSKFIIVSSRYVAACRPCPVLLDRHRQYRLWITNVYYNTTNLLFRITGHRNIVLQPRLPITPQ